MRIDTTVAVYAYVTPFYLAGAGYVDVGCEIQTLAYGGGREIVEALHVCSIKSDSIGA